MLPISEWNSGFRVGRPETSESLPFHSQGQGTLEFTKRTPRSSLHLPAGIWGDWFEGPVVFSS